MRRVPSSEETVTVTLGWADDGERNFKGTAGGAMTKNQKGVATGIRQTWPDLVLGYIYCRIWQPKPPQTSTTLQQSQNPGGSLETFVCHWPKNTPRRSVPRASAENDICIPLYRPLFSPFVGLSGYLRFCCHHLKRQDWIWNIYFHHLGHSEIMMKIILLKLFNASNFNVMAHIF